jgi:cyclic pyranopterin phosphate synthase
MTPEEIEAIVKIASELGIRKIKLTGGEPLIRQDIIEIVKRISPFVEEVSMTTNASKLTRELACELKKAGLARVNISFHSLNPKTFQKITGQKNIAEIKTGIESAIDCGLTPIKLNVVIMKGINSDEILDYIEFAKNTGTILQLIEYQALQNDARASNDYHYDLLPLEQKLSLISTKILERELHHRKQYYLREGGIVEVVRPIHNSQFCEYCTRLRLTSDGRLKACLMRDDNLVDLITLIRKKAPKEELIYAFREAVERREPFWRI